MHLFARTQCRIAAIATHSNLMKSNSKWFDRTRQWTYLNYCRVHTTLFNVLTSRKKEHYAIKLNHYFNQSAVAVYYVNLNENHFSFLHQDKTYFNSNFTMVY